MLDRKLGAAVVGKLGVARRDCRLSSYFVPPWFWPGSEEFEVVGNLIMPKVVNVELGGSSYGRHKMVAALTVPSV
jgi:hypothetical protein